MTAIQSTTLTFDRIEARPVMLKLKRPIQARIGGVSDWPVILIDLHTREGIVGKSYLEPYLPNSMKYLMSMLKDLSDALKGRQVAPADIYNIARKSLHLVGYPGLSMIAVSGLDMAAWDALAKSANLPLCTFLGGSVGPVNAYQSSGLWLIPPESAEEEAIQLRDEGNFTAMKMRMGREHLRDDLATLKAVRKGVGDDMRLMVDFNQSLHIGDALLRCRAIDDLGFEWIEEPLLYDNFDGYAKLREAIKTPLQMGENFYGPLDVHRAIQMNTCDLMMPDFMRIGGVTGWMRAAAIAGVAGVPMSTHFYPEVGAHVLRVTETAHLVEWIDWVNPVLQKPYEIRNGQVIIPDAPGLGMEWDEDFVRGALIQL
ncbi:enolase C-terminal domain-like protein [Variovorax sp. dw_954]|uniref:enolase C-terminal domain-like protein n=1 Tax=Variovorax sp. dw_954 TaxID=2720078 RepID=UPI001BD69D0F|nr:enolase C-terminal domain-like protein [Variovorax sp. dw_954]